MLEVINFVCCNLQPRSASVHEMRALVWVTQSSPVSLLCHEARLWSVAFPSLLHVKNKKRGSNIWIPARYGQWWDCYPVVPVQSPSAVFFTRRLDFAQRFTNLATIEDLACIPAMYCSQGDGYWTSFGHLAVRSFGLWRTWRGSSACKELWLNFVRILGLSIWNQD